MDGSWDLYTDYRQVLPRQEQIRMQSSRVRCCRISLQQYAELLQQPMRHYIWRIRRWED